MGFGCWMGEKQLHIVCLRMLTSRMHFTATGNSCRQKGLLSMFAVAALDL